MPQKPQRADPEDYPGEQFSQLDAALDAAKRGPLWLAAPELADPIVITRVEDLVPVPESVALDATLHLYNVNFPQGMIYKP